MDNLDQTTEIIKKGDLAEIETLVDLNDLSNNDDLSSKDINETEFNGCSDHKIASLQEAKQVFQHEVDKIEKKIATICASNK